MTSIRVLIVDDMPQVRQDLRTVLTLAGQASGTLLEIVGEAANGQEAIHQVEKHHPDAVLMDLGMPVMDGWTATCRIKALFPSIRVIAITVYGDPESRQKAYQSGADGFIEKGAPIYNIIQAICKKEIDSRSKA